MEGGERKEGRRERGRGIKKGGSEREGEREGKRGGEGEGERRGERGVEERGERERERERGGGGKREKKAKWKWVSNHSRGRDSLTSAEFISIYVARPVSVVSVKDTLPCVDVLAATAAGIH